MSHAGRRLVLVLSILFSFHLFLLRAVPGQVGFGTATIFAYAAASTDFSLLPQKSISADFDGDHLADIASGRYHGQTYSVEIGFSTGRSPASLSFKSACPDFSIFAHDIDSDNDEDLVV